MVYRYSEHILIGTWDFHDCTFIKCTLFYTQGSGGLISQHAAKHGSQHSYASVASQGPTSSGDDPTSKSHGSHMTSQGQSHDQRQLYSVEDEDDDRPPSTHAVHS